METDIATYVAIVIGIANLVVTTIGASVVVWGMNQWRRQIEYNTRLDLAKRLMILAFKFENEFPKAQSPFSFTSESEGRIRKETETDREKSVLDNRYAHLKRLEPLGTIIQEMKAVNWEIKATIGADFSNYIDNYDEYVRKLWLAIVIVFDLQTDQYISHSSDNKDMLVEIAKQHEILFGYERGKVLQKSINKTTEELTQLLTQYTFRKNRRNKTQSYILQRQTKTSEAIELEKRVKELEEKLARAQSRLSGIDISNADTIQQEQTPKNQQQK